MTKSDKRRRKIPFRSVNRKGDPGYDPRLQRHHLLPVQLLSRHCFGLMFDKIGPHMAGFEDFRSNGLLLPANEEVAVDTGRPLHRGPHRQYNEMVIDRVGSIEAGWSKQRLKDTEDALDVALMRLELLQRALRRRLLDPAQDPFPLHRRDPLREPVDFADLDDMADALWGETAKPVRKA